jgi:hypothetical protein
MVSSFLLGIQLETFEKWLRRRSKSFSQNIIKLNMFEIYKLV